MTLLAARGVRVDYADGPALGPVDLALAPSTITALLGPSGCGKSTLLLALAGLTPPSEGSVDLPRDAPGVVFQEPTLAPWADVLSNVALPLRLRKEPQRSAEARARAALAAVGLEQAASLRPAALSGGMRMRVALARALVAEPAALLLDEPFAAIDELGRRALDDLILRLKAERRLAVLFVTHSVEEAVYVADRVVVMTPKPGRITGEVAVSGDGERGDPFLASEAFREAARSARSLLARAHAA